MKIWPFARPAPETKSAPPETGPACVIHPVGGIFGGLAPVTVALRIPAVASAVQTISEAVATLDVFVVELKDGQEIKVDDHSHTADGN